MLDLLDEDEKDIELSRPRMELVSPKIFICGFDEKIWTDSLCMWMTRNFHVVRCHAVRKSQRNVF